LYTQPISFLGLPVVAAPLPVEGLPMGVQLIAAHGQDGIAGIRQNAGRQFVHTVSTML
jgi:hypothetical protein